MKTRIPETRRRVPCARRDEENDVLDFRAARSRRVASQNARASTRDDWEIEDDAPQARRELEEHERETQHQIARDEKRARREKQLEAREEKQRAKQKNCPSCHWGLLVSTVALALFSILAVYSASMALALDHNRGDSNFFLWRQVAFVAVGLAAFLGVSRFSASQMRGLVWGFYFATFVGLLLIEVTPLGTDLGSGAKRWLGFGPLPLPPQQCSEWAKIALIGVMADFWSRAAGTSQKSLRPWFWAAVISLPIVLLVFMQPHLSAALLLLTIPFGIAYYADVPLKKIGVALAMMAVIGGGSLAFGSRFGLPGLKPYQIERITSHFSHGDKNDGQGMKYQVEQSRHALVNGGWFGYGPGNSPSKHGYLPAPHTDFILAVVGEEWGLAGLVFLLAVYGAMIFFCLQVGHCANTAFEALLCSGVGTLLALQVVGNVCVVTGLAPVTGMPLPLLSYGGSGLVFTLIGIGMVLGVSRGHGREDAVQDARAESAASTREARAAAI